jgi:malate dehydrogenase
MGVPVQLGKHGVEKVIEIQLTKAETTALHISAAAIQQNIDLL